MRLRQFKSPPRPDHGRFSLPVKMDGRIVAFLQPVSKDWANDQTLIRLLAEWRAAHHQAFPSIFPVTHEGTGKWVKVQLIERGDRILFLLVTREGLPVGHLGLSNFDLSGHSAEMVDILRGVNHVLPGGIGGAIRVLQRWAFEELRLRKLWLRVFLDNERAIRLYESCGFRETRRIPLHKTVYGEITRFEEIPFGSGWSVDRVFSFMEVHHSKFGKPGRSDDTMDAHGEEHV